jgi:hypothetical protein
MSALIARGEALHREQSEKVFAAWRVAHGMAAQPEADFEAPGVRA